MAKRAKQVAAYSATNIHSRSTNPGRQWQERGISVAVTYAYVATVYKKNRPAQTWHSINKKSWWSSPSECASWGEGKKIRDIADTEYTFLALWCPAVQT